jgi:hypothetical protein
MEAIERTIEEFRDVVRQAEASAPSVSGWTVGEHIHHCGLSMIGIAKSLRKSTPPAPRAKPSLARSIVLLGYIPRGRARSPSFVVPKPAVPQDELLAMLDQAASLLTMAKDLDRGTWFTHPLLGTMNRDQAFKFVLVHNRHHLRIVADILRRARS